MERARVEVWVEQMVSAWNRHDAPGVAACYAEDTVISSVGEAEPVQGAQALAETLATLFDAFPDIAHQTLTALIDGDCVVLEWLLHGTHSGLLPAPAGFLPPTGNRIEIPGVSLIWLNGEGKASREHSYTDPTLMARQLGLYHEHQDHDTSQDDPDAGYGDHPPKQ